MFANAQCDAKNRSRTQCNQRFIHLLHIPKISNLLNNVIYTENLYFNLFR